MALDSQFRMPGAFHTEGVHPGIFRPPPRITGRTPSNSGFLPSRTAADEANSSKRKRHQDDRFSRQTAVASGMDNHAEQYTAPRASGWGSGKRYLLAGQVDYSGGDSGDVLMGESMYSDSDYRRELGGKRSREVAEVNGPVRSIFPSSSAQEEAYQSQQSQLAIQAAAQKPASWGSFAVSALGGVVGRIWQFCTTTNFKGFHAGGGRGYQMRQGLADDSVFQDDFFDNHQHPHRSVPGYFPPPADDLEDPFACASRDSSPAAPPAKRRQMTGTTNDLKKDWVFIDNGGEQKNNQAHRATGSPISRNSRPSVVTGRRISTPNTRRTQASRPSMVSMASTPTVTGASGPATTASTASYASPRSQSPSKIPVYTPSSSVSTSKQGASRRRSTATPGALGHRRTNSAASMASGRASVRPSQGSFSSDKHHSQHDHVDSSPRLSAEARKLAARRKREEEDADERMSIMGSQLQDMIRQAKEALGTTIEVEGDDDGGWEDEVY